MSALAYEANTLLNGKDVSGVLYPYNAEKSNTQKSEISSKSMLKLQSGPQTCLLQCWGKAVEAVL